MTPYGATICEIGAGTGNLLSALTRAFSIIHVVEPSEPMIARLRAALPSITGSVRVYQAMAEHLPLSDKSVDIALAKSSLHHFRDQNYGLREMARIARRAIAVVEVISPDDICLEYARTLVLGKEGGRCATAIYTEDSLRELLNDRVTSLRGLHFDQYIDIKIWLAASDLPQETQESLFNYTLSQTGPIREKMQIHFRHGRLVQLRRMLLLIGVL